MPCLANTAQSLPCESHHDPQVAGDGCHSLCNLYVVALVIVACARVATAVAVRPESNGGRSGSELSASGMLRFGKHMQRKGIAVVTSASLAALAVQAGAAGDVVRHHAVGGRGTAAGAQSAAGLPQPHLPTPAHLEVAAARALPGFPPTCCHSCSSTNARSHHGPLLTPASARVNRAR